MPWPPVLAPKMGSSTLAAAAARGCCGACTVEAHTAARADRGGSLGLVLSKGLVAPLDEGMARPTLALLLGAAAAWASGIPDKGSDDGNDAASTSAGSVLLGMQPT